MRPRTGEIQRGNRACSGREDGASSVGSDWQRIEKSPSMTVNSDSDQRGYRKSPRRSDEEDDKEYKRRRGYYKEAEWKVKPQNEYKKEKGGTRHVSACTRQ